MPQYPKERQPENRWTPEEDKILLSAIERCGPVIVWSQVSACLPSRNSKSCRKRWIHSLDPTLRKGRWTKEEDALLITAVETCGPHWFQVAKVLPGRTDDQCAKRWRENLDPSISRTPWTKEDDELLMKTYEKIGKRWKDLASHFQGRPPVHCRNRVQSLVRARRRATAAARKATQAILKEETVVDKETLTTGSPLGFASVKKDITNPPEENFVSPGRPSDPPSPTPPSNVSYLDRPTQQPHYTASVPTHPIQEINDNFLIAPTSSQPYHSFVSTGSYTPDQSDHSQSTSPSPPLWDTPPHPHFIQPHIHGESPWRVLPSQLPSTLHETDPMFSGWAALCPHPQFEQAAESQFPHSCADSPTFVPVGSCHPRTNSWWQHDSATPINPGKFFHQAHHSLVFGSTYPNYTIHPPVQVLNPELLYSPFLPCPLTTSSG